LQGDDLAAVKPIASPVIHFFIFGKPDNGHLKYSESVEPLAVLDPNPPYTFL
jgi:hypothetical protein